MIEKLKSIVAWLVVGTFLVLLLLAILAMIVKGVISMAATPMLALLVVGSTAGVWGVGLLLLWSFERTGPAILRFIDPPKQAKAKLTDQAADDLIRQYASEAKEKP